MRPLSAQTGDGILLADAQATLPFPPVAASLAMVTAWNSDQQVGVVPEFDLEIWAPAANNLTAAEIFGAALHPLVVADAAFTAANTDIITSAAHGLLTGDGPLRVSTAGVLPGGLAAATDYWFIKIDANTGYLAASLANALEGSRVDILDAGTGVHTYSDVATTSRVYWHTHGLLGLASDGAVALTAQKAYVQRCRHRPRTVAYAVSATLSASVASVRAVAVRDR